MSKVRWEPETQEVNARAKKILWREIHRLEKLQDIGCEEGAGEESSLTDKEIRRVCLIIDTCIKLKRSELLQEKVDYHEISEMDPAEIQELADELLDNEAKLKRRVG